MRCRWAILELCDDDGSEARSMSDGAVGRPVRCRFPRLEYLELPALETVPHVDADDGEDVIETFRESRWNTDPPASCVASIAAVGAASKRRLLRLAEVELELEAPFAVCWVATVTIDEDESLLRAKEDASALRTCPQVDSFVSISPDETASALAAA